MALMSIRVAAVLALVMVLAGCNPQGVPQVFGALTLLRYGQPNSTPAALFKGRVGGLK